MTESHEPPEAHDASPGHQGYLDLSLGPVPENDARRMARKQARGRIVPAFFIAVGITAVATFALSFALSTPGLDPDAQLGFLIGTAVFLVGSIGGVALLIYLAAVNRIRGRKMVFGRITGMAFQMPSTSQTALVLRLLRILPPVKPNVAGHVRDPERMPPRGITDLLLPLAHIHYVYDGQLREWEGYVHAFAPVPSGYPSLSLGLVGCLARLAVRPGAPGDVLFMEVFPEEGYPASLPPHWPFRSPAEADGACGLGGPRWWLADHWKEGQSSPFTAGADAAR